MSLFNDETWNSSLCADLFIVFELESACLRRQWAPTYS